VKVEKGRGEGMREGNYKKRDMGGTVGTEIQ